jgi:uncharacterized membrane protein
MIESHKRTLARTVSYRVLALIITALITGLGTAVIIHLLLTLVHYAHERVWLKIKWETNDGN